jgi:hypothetical protein
MALGSASGARAADGVDLAWPERTVDQLAGGQLRFVVPLVGGSLSPASSAPLGRLLDRLWVDRFSRPRYTSVVATIGKPTGEARHELTLLVGVETGSGATSRADEILMYRQLRTALRQVEGGLTAIA